MAKKRETPDQLQHISKLPVPDIESLDEDLQKYMRICKEKLGLIPNVIRAFALRPEKLRTFIGKYNELMLGEDALLTRLEREMIAVVVSSHNHCVYCITSHSQAVRELADDPVLGDILMINYREAKLTERQRAILDYAFKLTSNPAELGDEDRAKLTAVGLGPKEIFEVTDTTAYFNYTNRMTHGLGMLPNEEYFGMNRLPDPGAHKAAAE